MRLYVSTNSGSCRAATEGARMRALDVLVDRLDHDWYRGYYDAASPHERFHEDG